MSKRKLNRRQKWRIEKIQAEKASRANKKTQKVIDDVEGSELGPERTGRILAHFGQTLEVEPLDQENEEAAQLRCFARANLGALVTGDEVVFRASTQQQGGVIEALLPRRSLLQRPDNHGQLKPVAANVDRIVIVVAVEPTPHANLIDRYLVAAETLDITPAILFNKSDLLTEDNRASFDALFKQYQDLGYEVLLSSANDIEHCETDLLDWLSGLTSVFVGQSGVGKSSLIRSILGDDSIKIGALSELSRKGTHTTTTARLFHLPRGGRLIDSPGIREFGLWHIDEHELIEGFIEFRPFLGLCKFRDCKHESEPGCAIHEALDNKQISEQRMQSYLRIRATLDDIETFE